jgi:hypothetical protein
MPGYIIKQLQLFKHASPTRPQHCPFYPQLKQYNSAAQRPIEPNMIPPLSKEDIKQVQNIIRSILYYAQAVNLTVLRALSRIASKQAKGTKSTMKKCIQLLDYLVTHPNATVQYLTSDMILTIHSDASYLSKANAYSRACGHFFMGWQPVALKPIN